MKLLRTAAIFEYIYVQDLEVEIATAKFKDFQGRAAALNTIAAESAINKLSDNHVFQLKVRRMPRDTESGRARNVNALN